MRDRRAFAAALALGIAVGGLACSSFSESEAPREDAGGAPTADAADPGDAAAGPDGQDGGKGSAGCADGTREGFFDAPTIAACEGAWSVPGIFPSPVQEPTCGRRAGNTGDPQAVGCSAADLCSAGWHVCKSYDDVATKRGPTAGPCGIAGVDGGDVFYATAQGSTGSPACGPAQSTAVEDVFGCGNFHRVAAASCQPLNSYITFADHPPSFTSTSATAERATVTKGPGPGGVLCCID